MDVSLKLDAWRKKVESAIEKESQVAPKVTNSLPGNSQDAVAVQKATEAKQAIDEVTVTVDPWLVAKEKMVMDEWGNVDAEAANNFLWFYRNIESLPLVPFTLNETSLEFNGYEPQEELRIKNPENFYKTLKASIGIGSICKKKTFQK